MGGRRGFGEGAEAGGEGGLVGAVLFGGLLEDRPVVGADADWSSPAFVRVYLTAALQAAGISKHIRPFHDLRHTALTHDAATGNPLTYIQHRAGHSQATITERYIHAAQVQFTGAAERAERRMFGAADA